VQIGRQAFDEVILADFEFEVPLGERPRPVCLVARELVSGRVHRLWRDELQARAAAPYPTGRGALFVAYFASAELGCHLALGWPLPDAVLDLFVEYRVATNGLPTPCGWGLLGALAHHGLDAMAGSEKEAMRDLVLRGGPWSQDEQQAVLDYCAEDVAALARLLPVMSPRLDMPRAVLRGAYMRAVARMEYLGVPVDAGTLAALREGWDGLKDQLVARVDQDYGVFEAGSFKAHRWAAWLARQGIPWPRLESGALALDDDTFRQAARAHPAIAPMHELRHALSQLRLSDLAVGQDSRNRVMLSPFRARSGRNQPSNSRFIFGPSVWLRSLIRPESGRGLAYIDWSQQEFGIAAALSGDQAMAAAYVSGDPYITFAKQAGAVPPKGTKETHGPTRELFKAAALAVQYGMGHESLAGRLGVSPARARELLEAHRSTYRRFWRWSDAAVDHAMLRGQLHTVFGWTLRVTDAANARSLRNYPMQGNGAEMLRLACILATERGVAVVAPIHDALLIEAPLDELDQVVAETQAAMAAASRIVLTGFELRSDVKLIRYPDRYQDGRGRRMWELVQELLAHRTSSPTGGTPVQPTVPPVGLNCPVGATPVHSYL
jgi:hypothetical protein